MRAKKPTISPTARGLELKGGSVLDEIFEAPSSERRRREWDGYREWCPLPSWLRGWGVVSSSAGSGAEIRPETHFCVFWRPQNATFRTYMPMLSVRQCLMSHSHLGARLRYGAIAPWPNIEPPLERCWRKTKDRRWATESAEVCETSLMSYIWTSLWWKNDLSKVKPKSAHKRVSS